MREPEARDPMSDQQSGPAEDAATPAADDESGITRAGEVMLGGRLKASDTSDLTPRREELRALADATRLLIDRLVATDAPSEVIAAATADVQAAADRFDGYHQGSIYSFAESANAGGRDEALYDHSPLIGIANALAPPIEMSVEDGIVSGLVTFGSAYEGPPGCVHGGYVAAAFDELLGLAQSLSGSPGMTGTLSVRYESPTPLHTPLRLTGRLVGVERRKIFTEGEIHAGHTLTARAEGTFISLRPGAFLGMLVDRQTRRGHDA